MCFATNNFLRMFDCNHAVLWKMAGAVGKWFTCESKLIELGYRKISRFVSVSGISYLRILKKWNPKLKAAEHSFRAHSCIKTNMASKQRSFYLLNVRAICTIFVHKWTQCIDGFTLLVQRYVRKGNDAKISAQAFSLLLKEPTKEPS